MLKIIFILAFAAFYIVYGHNDLKPNDGDMQSALMPQELNPVFVPDSEAEMKNLHKELNQLRRDMEELKRRNGLPSSYIVEEHPVLQRNPKPVQKETKPPSQVTEALREILGDITRATNRSYALINLISKPWRSVIPLMPRSRRDSVSGAVLLDETSSMQQVKSYTRIFSCVVLAVAAVVELVVYCIESYYG